MLSPFPQRWKVKTNNSVKFNKAFALSEDDWAGIVLGLHQEDDWAGIVLGLHQEDDWPGIVLGLHQEETGMS